jgi:sec-independent protein translocase protein TatC
VTDADHTPADEPQGMSFLDHLEELRWRIVKAAAGILIGSILCWIFIDQIINSVLLRPIIALNETLGPGQQPIRLQNLKPFGQVFL